VETFPEPPPVAELQRLGTRSHLHVLPAGTEFWRIYFRGGTHPTTWNTFRAFGPVVNARFDHHLPPPRTQERAILYAATDGATCLAEVFQESRVIDPAHNAPWLVSFRIVSDLTLLDLTGLWPTYAGGSQEINTGERSRTRRWSEAIYLAFPHVHGLWYRSKMHGGTPSIALYERAAPSLPASPSFHAALASPTMFDVLKDVAARLGYILM
jgi:hypothetical protein